MTCAHRNLHPGREVAPYGDTTPRTRCLDCGTVLVLTTVMMTPAQTADVMARLRADARYHAVTP